MAGKAEHRSATRNNLDDVEVLALCGAGAVRVYDVSEGGLALLTEEAVAPGTVLEVHTGGQQSARVEVRYCEELPARGSAPGQRYRVGTRFLDSSVGPDRCSQILARHQNLAVYAASAEAAAPELRTPAPGERRIDSRMPVPDLPAEANGYAVVVKDVCCDGLAILTADPLLPGEAFSMTFPDYPPLQLVARHCEPLREQQAGGARYRVGARFIVPDPDHPLYATALDAFIASLVQRQQQ